MRKKKNGKILWRKGGGELIGFGIVMPMLVFMFCCIISAAQVSMATETLQYAAYSSCRAAVVSADKVTAESRAKTVAMEMAEDSGVIETDTMDVTLTLLDTTLPWMKGNFVRCDVSAYVKTMAPFTSGMRTASIVMMVERPSS